MQLIRGLHNLKLKHKKCVVTIGNFDGVHVGHQTILSILKKKSENLGIKLCVIIFEPQPLEYLAKHNVPERLMSLRDKLFFLSKCDVDQVLCLSFNKHIQKMTPDGFVYKILVHGLEVKFILVGNDFHYGINRTGDFNHLKRLGPKNKYEAIQTNAILDMDTRISSTKLREVLKAGNLNMAERLLGRPFTLLGRVIKGNQRGQKLGVPTANILLHQEKLPIQGVFLVRVYIKNLVFMGVANLGNRPTINDNIILLEVHVLEFNGLLYNQILRVEFIKKIREIKKFSSIEALKLGINNDIKKAKELLYIKSNQ